MAPGGKRRDADSDSDAEDIALQQHERGKLITTSTGIYRGFVPMNPPGYLNIQT